MRAIRLRTDYLTNPLGLGNPKPRFYWNCDGGVRQTAYRIICRCDRETLWDSGKVSSEKMTHIPYEGTPLGSRRRIEWNVTLWDETGKAGEAVSAFFEMGLLSSFDWRAKWIGGGYRPKKNMRYPVDCFRKTFSTHGAVKTARLYATACGVYDVTINGIRIEDFILAPGMTDYRKRIQYQTYDVTNYIKEENTVDLRVADGWFRGSIAAYGVTNVFGDMTSIMAQLEISYADESTETICTDETWLWSNDGPIRFADLKDGEVYDARRSPSYSKKVRVVPAPKAKILASDNVPVTEHERFKPKLINGNILDFGQNIAGYLEFCVHGKAGQCLALRMGEVLDENGALDLSGIQETKPADGWTKTKLMKKLLQMEPDKKLTVTPKQEISMICADGENRYKTSFCVFGFRYAEITGSVRINPDNFTAIAVYSDMEETGTFSCSDKRINKLVDNTRWSMKGNFLDLPTDCPTRERLGWTGDAQIFFETGAYLMDTAAFFRKWLRDMEDAQYRNGVLPAVLPYTGAELMYKATGTAVGWADAVYLIPYRYWKIYGDLDILKKHWPMMKKYADYLESRLEKDGHYEKGVHLGEWLEPEEFRKGETVTKMKHPETCTAYLYFSMVTMAEIAAKLQEHDLAAHYTKIAETAKRIYPQYADFDTDRQAMLVRPLALGLLDGVQKKMAEKRLIEAVENYHYRVGTGFLSTPFLLPVLTEAGGAKIAYKMLLNTEKPGWLYEVEHGATTVWESWEGDLSQNHYSPGAVCQWLFDSCAGIRVDGENHFIISPLPGGGLTYAKASYNSLYGRVESSFERTEDGIKFSFCIPKNCTAELHLLDGRKYAAKAGTYDYEIGGDEYAEPTC